MSVIFLRKNSYSELCALLYTTDILDIFQRTFMEKNSNKADYEIKYFLIILMQRDSSLLETSRYFHSKIFMAVSTLHVC